VSEGGKEPILVRVAGKKITLEHRPTRADWAATSKRGLLIEVRKTPNGWKSYASAGGVSSVAWPDESTPESKTPQEAVEVAIAYIEAKCKKLEVTVEQARRCYTKEVE
jgi:hypothetical protein